MVNAAMILAQQAVAPQTGAPEAASPNASQGKDGESFGEKLDKAMTTTGEVKTDENAQASEAKDVNSEVASEPEAAPTDMTAAMILAMSTQPTPVQQVPAQQINAGDEQQSTAPIEVSSQVKIAQPMADIDSIAATTQQIPDGGTNLSTNPTQFNVPDEPTMATSSTEQIPQTVSQPTTDTPKIEPQAASANTAQMAQDMPKIEPQTTSVNTAPVVQDAPKIEPQVPVANPVPVADTPKQAAEMVQPTSPEMTTAQAQTAAQVVSTEQAIPSETPVEPSKGELTKPDAKAKSADNKSSASQTLDSVSNVPVAVSANPNSQQASPQSGKSVGVDVISDSLSAPRQATEATPNANPSPNASANAAQAAMNSVDAHSFQSSVKEAMQRQGVDTSAVEQNAKVVIDQIIRDVRLNKTNGQNDIVINLTPPELGNLRVQISQDGSVFSSQITASSDSVRGMLQAHLPALMDSLSSAGIKMDSVSVSVNNSFNSFAQDAAQQQAQAGQDHRSNRSYSGRNGNIGAMGSIDPSILTQSYTNSAGYSWLA